MMAKVMFDIDGVLRDFSTGWRDMVAEVYGKRPPPSASWDFLEEYGKRELGMTPAQFRHWLFAKNGYNVMRNSPAYPGAVDAWNKIRAAGHYIIVITHQDTLQTMDGTFRWLSDRHMIPDMLKFSNVKWCDADFYIEDKHSELEKLADLVNCWSTTVVGVRRIWNDPDGIEGVRAVDSVAEYPAIIEEVINDIRRNCGFV